MFFFIKGIDLQKCRLLNSISFVLVNIHAYVWMKVIKRDRERENLRGGGSYIDIVYEYVPAFWVAIQDFRIQLS